jgi:hypothetical protein
LIAHDARAGTVGLPGVRMINRGESSVEVSDLAVVNVARTRKISGDYSGGINALSG